MANDEPDKEVVITLDATGLPIPSIDPIPVKKGRQKIRWCAAFEFDIAIEGYGDVKYSTGNPGCAFAAKTGVFTAAAGTRYKYSITANGQTHDPDIDIKP